MDFFIKAQFVIIQMPFLVETACGDLDRGTLLRRMRIDHLTKNPKQTENDKIKRTNSKTQLNLSPVSTEDE